MHFILLLSEDGIEFFDGIPIIPDVKDNVRLRIFPLDEKDDELMCRYFTDAALSEWDLLLGIGDFDFIDSEKCASVIHWIDGQLKNDLPAALKRLYVKLAQYCQEALRLGTGVYISL